MAKSHARPIKTERDHKSAALVADEIRKQQPGHEPDAERRLQALIEAMEKFDDEGGDEDSSDATEDIDGLPRRRWSDDASEPE